MDNKALAQQLFLNHLVQYSTNDIVEIKPIHQGFTNISFYLKTADNSEFQIRLGHNNNIVNRYNEEQVLLAIHDENYLYYDVVSGDAIKRWIDGDNIDSQTAESDSFLNKLLVKIDELHQTNITGYKILKHDYMVFFAHNDLEEEYKNKYVELVNKLDKNNWVLSHNDLNALNILMDYDKNLHFIDYEWSRINHPLWDIANFTREVNLPEKQIQYLVKKLKLDLKEFYEFLYICTCFAYQWTFYTMFSQKISEYRKHTLILMQEYYNKLITF